MKKQQVMAFLILVVLASTAVSVVKAASLAKPAVTLPGGWQLDSETPYPNAESEHDPQGAGLLTFTDQEDYDGIMIYYENAPSTAYTSTQLRDEAEDIFNREHDIALGESGVTEVAGVSAGFAKGYEADLDVYTLELVFVKGDYYFNVYAYYDATTQDEAQVNSLIGSISAGSAVTSLPGWTLYVIIGVVAVIIVIVVLAVVMRRKKKPSLQATASPQYSYPPPPSPASMRQTR